MLTFSEIIRKLATVSNANKTCESRVYMDIFGFLFQEMSKKTEQLRSEKNATISRLQQQVNSLNLDIQVNLLQ